VYAKIAYATDDREVWVVSLPDGIPYPVGGGFSPRWSPSGGWLSFKDGDYFEVVRDDGSRSRRIQSTMLAWAPNADRLAYVTRTGEIVVEDAGGSNSMTVVASQGSPISFPYRFNPSPITGIAWSPDGSQIAYALTTQIAPGAGAGPDAAPMDECDPLEPGYNAAPLYRGPRYSGLWLVSVQGGSSEQVFDSGGSCAALGEVSIAGWSAAGDQLLFWLAPGFGLSRDGLLLYAVASVGGEPRLLSPTLTFTDFIAAQPGDRLMAVTSGAGIATWTNKRISVVDPATRTISHLTDKATAAFSPVWSPDGTRLAYVSAPAIDTGGGDLGLQAGAQRRIWVMNADGSGKARLTEDGKYREERPHWSADGRAIFFARLDEEGQTSLWLVDAAGGIPTRVIDRLGFELPGYLANGYYGYLDWDSRFDLWTAP
jgi:Tol biopolymer transport system component